MAFCKICQCGEIITFEKVFLCPMTCPSCGRMTQAFPSYSENDPVVVNYRRQKEFEANQAAEQAMQQAAAMTPPPMSDMAPPPPMGGSGNMAPPPPMGGSGNMAPPPPMGESGNMAPPPPMGGSGNMAPPPPMGGSGNMAPPMGGSRAKKYVLSAANGSYEIVIPPEGGVLGRTGIGAEELAHNEAVSRQHLKITIRKRMGVFVEDISSFGTKVNGEELFRGDQVMVPVGSHITLYNEELILEEREV